MAAGPDLIEAVAGVLIHAPDAMTPGKIQKLMESNTTKRAIRYAIAELIKSGRAQRKGTQGPVTAVREKT